jgi:hypothetical protein
MNLALMCTCVEFTAGPVPGAAITLTIVPPDLTMAARQGSGLPVVMDKRLIIRIVAERLAPLSIAILELPVTTILRSPLGARLILKKARLMFVLTGESAVVVNLNSKWSVSL